jgi:hypothetical protein
MKPEVKWQTDEHGRLVQVETGFDERGHRIARAEDESSVAAVLDEFKKSEMFAKWKAYANEQNASLLLDTMSRLYPAGWTVAELLPTAERMIRLQEFSKPVTKTGPVEVDKADEFRKWTLANTIDARRERRSREPEYDRFMTEDNFRQRTGVDPASAVKPDLSNALLRKFADCFRRSRTADMRPVSGWIASQGWIALWGEPMKSETFDQLLAACDAAHIL